MIVELSVVPIGVGESLSFYIAKVLEIIKKSGVKYDLNPMGTVFEVEGFSELTKILEKIDEAMIKLGSGRNYYVVKIDRRVRKSSMEQKVKSVIEKLSDTDDS